MNKFLSATLLISLLAITCSSHAQNKDKDWLGILIYFEGDVKISNSDTLKDAVINQKLSEKDVVQTGNEAAAEIRWQDGLKSYVGPNSSQNIATLHGSLNKNAKSKNQSIWSDFQNLFTSKSTENTQEEGGIRRSKAEVDEPAAPDELYWKEFKKITFEKAAEEYENENFVKSVKLFESFLDQNPNAENANYAHFALGHSYVELNNVERAQEVFKELKENFPDDPLAEKSEQFLNSIKQ